MADVIACSICINFYSEIQGDKFVTTRCGHFFHKFCLEPALAANDRCPTCRTKISSRDTTILHGINPTESVKEFKITVIGDSAVGKTSLARRYAQGLFTPDGPSTVGNDLWSKFETIGGEDIKLHIWDTSGQEKYKCISHQYIRNSQGVILVYDNNCYQSLKNIMDWHAFANKHCPNAIKIVVGCKTDLNACSSCGKHDLGKCPKPTEVQKEGIITTLKVNGFEASSKTSYNVDAVFRHLIGDILQTPVLVREARDNIQRRVRLPRGLHSDHQQVNSGCC